MAGLAEVLNDPNYVNANAATKAAIFDKFSASDINFTGANPETQRAIRTRFGLSPISPPSAAPSEIPAPRGEIPAWAREYPSLYGVAGAVRETLGPLVEMGGMIAGGLTGGAAGTFGAGPVGTAAGGIAGAGLGYGAGKAATRLADIALGNAPALPLTQTLPQAAGDILTGAEMETGGRILGPAAGRLIEAVPRGMAAGKVVFNRLLDPKSAAVVDAVEGKGRDIVNALRSPGATIVPGSAPTPGEIAAPIGSAKFSAFVESYKPGNASEFARMTAQTNAARIAQQARDVDRFATVASKVQAKVEAGLTDVSPRAIGEAIIDTAKAEQKVVKSNVIQPAYDRAFTAAGNAKIDVSDVVANAEKILERKLSDFAPETAPNTVRQLLGFIPKEQPTGPVILSAQGKPLTTPEVLPAQATLRQLDDVRKAINADIAAAKNSTAPSSDMTLRNLYQLHAAIDDAVKGSAALPAQAKQLYADALSKYRTEYVPRFKTGINANLFKQTALNEPKLNPDDVVSKFFQPKGEREASQFVALFGQNPKALQLQRAGIEDLYRQKVVDAVTGEVSPAKHAAFMRDYARPLDIMDAAGMNLKARLDIVNRDATRLTKIQDLAVANNIKLDPPLPAGANADAVLRRVQELTKGLSPRQLADVSAVARDIARENEYYILAAAGGVPKGGAKLATKELKSIGLPAPSLLSVPLTIFNAVVKKLAGKMDDKVAAEIARELSSPALTAQMIEKAMGKIQTPPGVVLRAAQQAAPGISAAARAGMGAAGVNQLAPQESQNRLAAP
jgi:hypothetical protein